MNVSTSRYIYVSSQDTLKFLFRKNMSLDMFGECVLNWSDLLFQANPEISKSVHLRLHH